MSYKIPCSRPEDWTRALEATADLARKCPDDHPLHMWRARTEQVLKQTGPNPQDVSDLAENLIVPASYLCRLGQSLAHVENLGPRVKSELKQVNDLDGFMHLEYMLYLGSRLASRGFKVAAIGQKPEQGRTPDLDVPDHLYTIECTARGPKRPRATLAEDFRHAQEKFQSWLSRGQRLGYSGVLATDLGVCGTPSLPNLARLGPDLGSVEVEISEGFASCSAVSAVLITWTGIEAVETGGLLSVGLTACSGWRTRVPGAQLPGITDEFDPWEGRRPEIAWRTSPDGRDPRR